MTAGCAKRPGSAAGGQQMARILYTTARLIDGEGPSRTGMTVVVEGERITRVCKDHAVDRRPDDEVYDLAGATLMPGMVIGHYHASYFDIGPHSLPVGMEAP